MAVKLVKVGNVYNAMIEYYEADTDTDKQNFDTSNIEMGTKMHVIATDKFYVCNSSHEWKETSYGGML